MFEALFGRDAAKVFSIISTIGSLFWTLMLLLMVFYCFSVACIKLKI